MTDAGAARRWLAGLCVLLLAACGEQPAVLPPLASGDVVLAFGDSLTYGTGAREGESYPEVLAELIGHEVVAAGVPGEQTAQGLARLDGVIDRYQPRILLLCLGGNDMLRKVAAREIENNLRRMIELAHGRGVGVLLIGVPRPALFGGTADFYARLADELAVPFEGGALNDILRNERYKSDPIHPNAEGYRMLARAIAEALKRAGAI